jgi:EAL domain-containing protein (putative c-di-GMP-specific phosphodiesterase class I)/GGDEF domain-containing protein
MKQGIIENEEARLNALRNLHLLDTPPSENFDRITRMASRLLGAPVSTVSLTDHDRQWFKSKVGLDISEIPRAEAPCNYAIHNEAVFVVPDMLDDVRFKTSAMAKAGIRFYAGAPLITKPGYSLGTLCIVDDKPRDISDDEKRLLVDLAAMVMSQVELQSTIGLVDPTSGLPNEHRLYEDLEDLAKRSAGEERVGLLIELVSQQQINHGLRVLGAEYTEELVRNSTQSIQLAVGENAAVYHVGNTRCLVILDDTTIAKLGDLTQNLNGKLRHAIQCSGIPVTVDPAIGVYVFRNGAVRARDVLRRLFNAVDDARQAGKPVAFYDEIHDQANARSFALLSDLHRALAQPGEFTLLYQPIIELASGRCSGAEALLRWRHPKLGDVSPGEFMPLVEETAFIRELTDWVFKTAIGQIAEWQKTHSVPKLSLNVSVRNLEDGDFAERLSAILAEYRVESRTIQVEFTEGALFSYSVRALEQLEALKRLGVSIVIDDFGTGYSSLSYLQRLPASIIKIDQAFIKSLATSDHNQTLVRAMIDLCHDLGFRVTAEGIEDQDSYDMLARWHCDEGQGFKIAPPLSATAMPEWLLPLAG